MFKLNYIFVLSRAAFLLALFSAIYVFYFALTAVFVVAIDVLVSLFPAEKQAAVYNLIVAISLIGFIWSVWDSVDNIWRKK